MSCSSNNVRGEPLSHLIKSMFIGRVGYTDLQMLLHVQRKYLCLEVILLAPVRQGSHLLRVGCLIAVSSLLVITPVVPEEAL